MGGELSWETGLYTWGDSVNNELKVSLDKQEEGGQR